MKDLIVKLLREATEAEHFAERLFQRFLDVERLVVGFELLGTRGIYETVGTYHLPQEAKDLIIQNVEEIVKFPFPKIKSFAVKIFEIRIDPRKVEYDGRHSIEDIKNNTLLFVDEQTNSNGNVIYVIIRENIIKTIYFGKNYIAQTKEKMDVDVITTMKAIREKKIR